MRCAAKSGWCSSPLTCSRRSEEHTSELQSQSNLVCRLLLEKKKYTNLPDRVRMPGRAIRACQRSWSINALAAAAVITSIISKFVMLTMKRYDRHEHGVTPVV